MPYALDAALFLTLACLLMLASCWRMPAQVAGLEAVVLGCCILLGASGSLLALQGHLLHSLTLAPPLLVVAGAWLWPLTAWRERNARLTQRFRAALDIPRGLRGWEWLPALYIGLVLLLTFLLCLVPPSGGDYDSLVYHLAAPRQYLRAGQVLQLRYDHHSYFPFTVEMLFLAGLSLRGPVLAKLFHWLMLPLCCLAIIVIGRRHLSSRAGLVAAAMFASLPLIQSEASLAYVDLAFAAFVLGAFLCFANWLASHDEWWLLPCAACCGFSMGTKYLGVLTFGWLLLWRFGALLHPVPGEPGKASLLTLYSRGGRGRFLVAGWSALRFAAVALLIGGGWYLRNWWWTGNPVFPFAYGLFGGRGWTGDMAAAYTADQMHFGFGRSAADLIMLPWRLAMSPLNYAAPWWPAIQEGSAPADHSTLFETGGNMLTAVLGPPLLAFGLAAAAMRPKPPLVRFLLWTFGAFFVFWAGTGQYMRYLVPPFALLCLPCGWALCRMLERGALLRWTVFVCALCWLGFAPLLTWHNARSEVPVVLGSESPAEYLSRTFPGYDAMQWASSNTPRGAKFAVYGEPRCYYLDRQYFWADQPHSTLINYGRVRSGSDLIAELRRQGASYVLWNSAPGPTGGVFGPPPQMDQAISEGRLHLLFEARGYRVYSIG